MRIIIVFLICIITGYIIFYTVSPTSMSRDEFYNIAKSNSADIKKLIGEPNNISHKNDFEYWTYKNKTFNPFSKKGDAYSQIIFKDNAVFDIYFIPENLDENLYENECSGHYYTPAPGETQMPKWDCVTFIKNLMSKAEDEQDQGYKGADYKSAKYELGFFYLMGSKVGHDLLKSYMWYSISAKSGNELAKKSISDSTNLVKWMTPEQQSKAEEFANDWLAKHPPTH